MSDTLKKLRCAIYVRKSTSEGLQQDFNSLDAQKEACQSYILAQKGEGWIEIQTEYCDGGFSGGNINRPGLQKLLEDIRAGLVDCVVCYKIDRISRSLVDFVGLVKLFDTYGVTFVSITQSFNTTTSMGRLTLNILLSFGQFERELAGERVRDKICASRKRGIWMGGFPPYGYDVVDRKLVPNVEEVKLVQSMFERFAVLQSIAAVSRELRADGVHTKGWTTQKGVKRTGQLIDRGYLYKLFRNPVVIGVSRYKGQHFDGEHPAIISRELWDQVQILLSRSDSTQRGRQNRESKAPSLLRGILWTKSGYAMTPTYTVKKGKHYRYYLCTKAIKIGPEACDVVRVPAGDIERAVLTHVRRVLKSPEVVAQTIREVQSLDGEIGSQQTIKALQNIESVWDSLFPAEQARIVHLLVDRVTISSTGIQIDMKTLGMDQLVQALMPDPLMDAA
jgi:DNA invertase Pin-like site-specific DNA recombinase